MLLSVSNSRPVENKMNHHGTSLIKNSTDVTFGKDLMMGTNTRILGRLLLLDNAISFPIKGAEWMVIGHILSNGDTKGREMLFAVMLTSDSCSRSQMNLMAG